MLGGCCPGGFGLVAGGKLPADCMPGGYTGPALLGAGELVLGGELELAGEDESGGKPSGPPIGVAGGNAWSGSSDSGTIGLPVLDNGPLTDAFGPPLFSPGGSFCGG